MAMLQGNYERSLHRGGKGLGAAAAALEQVRVSGSRNVARAVAALGYCPVEMREATAEDLVNASLVVRLVSRSTSSTTTSPVASHSLGLPDGTVAIEIVTQSALASITTDSPPPPLDTWQLAASPSAVRPLHYFCTPKSELATGVALPGRPAVRDEFCFLPEEYLQVLTNYLLLTTNYLLLTTDY